MSPGRSPWRPALLGAVVLVSALGLGAWWWLDEAPGAQRPDPILGARGGEEGMDLPPGAAPDAGLLDALATAGEGVLPLHAEPRGGTPAPESPGLREGAAVVTLRGRVVDDAGTPVAGAALRVGLHGADDQLQQPAWGSAAEAAWRRPPGSGVHADSDGRFTLFLDAAHLRTQSSAHAWVVALAPGFAALAHRTPELLSDTVDLGDLQLATGTELRAQTRGPGGQALPGVTVELLDLAPARPDDLRSGVRLGAQIDEQRYDEVLRAVLRTTSSVQGAVRLSGLPEGAATLNFSRPDLLELRLPDVVLTLPGPVDLGDVVLVPGGTIAGVLRDEQGVPVPDGYAAVIWRDTLASAPAGARTQAKAATDAEGRFAISGLHEGLYELSVSAPGHAWTHLPGVPTGTTDLQLVLPRSGELLISVRDALSGEPVPGAEVEARLPQVYEHLWGGTRWGYVVESDPAAPGVLRVRGIGLEGARLSVSAAGFARWSGEEGPLPPGAVVTREVRLDPGLHLAGLVIDGDDQPVAGARIDLHASALAAKAGSALTDKAGAFRIDDLSAGEFTIRASGPGLLESLDEALSLGASRDDFRVRLFRAASVAGRVLDRHGGPAPGTRVVAWPLDPAEPLAWLPGDPFVDLRSNASEPVPSVTAGEDGSYLLSRAVPGRYALFTTGDEGLVADLLRRRWNAQDFDPPPHAVQVQLVGGHELLRDLRVPPRTTLVGRVTEALRPVSDGLVSVVVPIAGNPPWREAAAGPTGAGGTYALDGLPPGRCVVLVRAEPGALSVARALMLVEDTEERFDVDLPGGVVRGTAVDEGTGEPAVGVSVSAVIDLSAGSPLAEATRLSADELQQLGNFGLDRASTTSDAAGRFELRGLPPGQVSVQAVGAGYLHAMAPWRKLPAHDPLEVTLKLTRGAVIEGTLARRDGTALDPNACYLELHELGSGQLFGYAYLADGFWRFEGLGGGQYELRLVDWSDESVLQRETLSVALGSSRHLDLLLDP